MAHSSLLFRNEFSPLVWNGTVYTYVFIYGEIYQTQPTWLIMTCHDMGWSVSLNSMGKILKVADKIHFSVLYGISFFFVLFENLEKVVSIQLYLELQI